MKVNFSKAVLCVAAVLSTQSMNAQVTIGADIMPKDGVLLELKEYNAATDGGATASKGLLYPRVALNNTNDLTPMVSNASSTTKKDYAGLSVYNVGTSNGFVPGLYVWNGENWIKPVTELPKVEATQVNVVDLVTVLNQNAQTKLTVVSGGDRAAFGALGTELKFGNPSNFGNIIIPEDGSYAFSFRFYGNISTNDFGSANTKTAIYYLSIWKENTSNNTNLKDIAEIDINVTKRDGVSVLDVYTYSITMGAFFKKGEKVIIKMSARSNDQDKDGSGKPKVWTWDLVSDPIRSNTLSAARTSMVWWRL